MEQIISKEKERPDIIIYKEKNSDEIICLLEFKKPIYEPDDEENLKEPARKKATQLKVRYFGTSNFQSLILFNTEKVNSLKILEEQIVGQYTLSLLEDINDIEQPKFRNNIYTALEKLLSDLAEFTTGKKPEPLIQIDQHLVWRLYDKVNRLSQYYKRIIEDEYHKNPKFRLDLKKWFTEQMWEFTGQDIDFVKAARQTSYLLINKIVFYNALQVKRKELELLIIPEHFTKGGFLKRVLLTYFNYVIEKIDYETIYSADFIDTLAFPDNETVVTEIKNLSKIFLRYDFSKLGYDIIGYIFEKLIPAEERHNLGQYFTNSNIVDIILRFCSKSEDAQILDPACGAGTFLVRAYQHKKMMNAKLKHEDILDTLWGVDIAKFPAHLATINLTINDLKVDKNFPNIIHKDFFELHATSQGLELSEDLLKPWRKVRVKDLSSNDREITYPRLFLKCLFS
ncbi:MAG: N-6 DNA methylase [Bacteroidia bacterium]|nr:N-6 DNA methylase [Bacteroidia bacterium]